MSKAEVLSDIMYELQFKDSLDIEVDEYYSHTIDKLEGNLYMISAPKHLVTNEYGQVYVTSNYRATYKGKSELRKAIAKLGKSIILM